MLTFFRVRILALMVLALTASMVAAEEIQESDAQIWLQYEYQRRIDENKRLYWNLGYRELVDSADAYGGWSRLHLRVAFVYQVRQRVSLTGGLGLFYSFQDVPADLFELRPWQALTVVWPAGTVGGKEISASHRFQLEQRITRYLNLDSDLDAGDFSVRFRYRLATAVPLNRPRIEARALYLPVMAEWFADPGNEVSELFAARLRLTAGLGYVFNDSWILEARYTAQRSRDTVIDVFQTTDHILDLRLRTSVRLRELLTHH